MRRVREDTVHRSLSVIAAVAIVAVAFGALYFYNLGGWLINDDEGSFLYQVWRITEGEQPYQDFFTSRWPLFLYTGAAWMRVAGAQVLPLRALCVALTLGTGVLTFLLAREKLPAEAALLAMFVFLVHPDVLRFGRAFQPEAFYVFFSVLGLYLFSVATTRGNLALVSAASLAFGVGSLYKLLTALVVAGCLLHLAVRWLRDRDSRWQTSRYALVFSATYGVAFGLSALVVMATFPAFGKSVIALQLTQGEPSPLSHNLAKGMIFLLRYVGRWAPFLLLSSPATFRGLKGSRSTDLFSWQLPTALAFTVLSRALFLRLLLYLTPCLSILCAASLEPVRRLRDRSLLLLAIVGALVVPWAPTDARVLLSRESATMQVARWIEDRTSADTRILSDYQELNFYARRPSTPLGAEISYVVLDSGQVTEDDLIADIEGAGAQMVVLDVSPLTAHHLVNVRNYEEFRAYLEEQFTLLDVVPRAEQELEIHVRNTQETGP